METPPLKIRLLPPSTIISGFVSGIKNCNYEFYLRELLNSSDHFIKRGGSPFTAPKSEDHGQCDAISQHYQIDFKLLASQTHLQAASILKPRPFVQGCLTFFTECKNPGGKIKATKLYSALRGLSVSDLETIRSNWKRGDSIDKDIAHALTIAEVKKNILFLFPYDLWFDKSIQHDVAVKIIEASLMGDFKNLFLYRDKAALGFDTYLTVKYMNEFLVFQIDKGQSTFVDAISTSEMPTYIELAQYSDMWG